MGVQSGGWGDGRPGRVLRPREIEKSAGDVPQNRGYFSIFFLDTYYNFALSSIFKIKWSKSEEKLNFGGRLGWVPMNPSPQAKLRDDALAVDIGDRRSPARGPRKKT